MSKRRSPKVRIPIVIRTESPEDSLESKIEGLKSKEEKSDTENDSRNQGISVIESRLLSGHYSPTWKFITTQT